jgi:hypothetical protein
MVECLVPVFRFGNNQPGQKGTQRQRQTDFGCQPSDGKTQHRRANEEEFATTGQSDIKEDVGHDPLRSDKDEDDDTNRLETQLQELR